MINNFHFIGKIYLKLLDKKNQFQHFIKLIKSIIDQIFLTWKLLPEIHSILLWKPLKPLVVNVIQNAVCVIRWSVLSNTLTMISRRLKWIQYQYYYVLCVKGCALTLQTYLSSEKAKVIQRIFWFLSSESQLNFNLEFSHVLSPGIFSLEILQRISLFWAKFNRFQPL